MPLDLLLKAIDYVIKLAERREKRARDRLTLVFEPMFTALQKINDDYVRMFESLRTALPTALERHNDRYRMQVLSTCRELRELRAKLASSREEVAAMSARLAQRDDLAEPEREFLWAVVAYLPLGLAAGEAPAAVGLQRVRTRATELEAALYTSSMELESPDVAAYLTRALQENSRFWQEVCAQFAQLKVLAAG